MGTPRPSRYSHSGRWSLQPLPGYETLFVRQSVPGPSEVAFYSVEWSKSANAVVRALQISGQQLWTTQLSSSVSPLSLHSVIPAVGEMTLNHQRINNLHDLFPNDLTADQWLNHDRISRAKLLNLGGGVAYSFHHSTANVFFSMGHSVYGVNTHLRSVVAAVGIVKSFATKLAGEKPTKLAFLPEASKALVCTCAKSR